MSKKSFSITIDVFFALWIKEYILSLNTETRNFYNGYAPTTKELKGVEVTMDKRRFYALLKENYQCPKLRTKSRHKYNVIVKDNCIYIYNSDANKTGLTLNTVNDLAMAIGTYPDDMLVVVYDESHTEIIDIALDDYLSSDGHCMVSLIERREIDIG